MRSLCGACGGGRAGSLRGALRLEEAAGVCFEEMPYQMVAEKRTPIRAKAGWCPQRYDYDYERRGVCNLLFMFFSPKASWRHVDLRERRTAVDFAHQMRKLAEEHYYPEAKKIRVVLWTTSTLTPQRRSL